MFLRCYHECKCLIEHWRDILKEMPKEFKTLMIYQCINIHSILDINSCFYDEKEDFDLM